MGLAVRPSESWRFEQEVYFDDHLYGSTGADFVHGGEAELRRGSDGFYWDGATFIAPQTWNVTTDDASGLFHYYDFTIPAGASEGDTFILRIRITGDPLSEATVNMITRLAASTIVMEADIVWDPIGGHHHVGTDGSRAIGDRS